MSKHPDTPYTRLICLLALVFVLSAQPPSATTAVEPPLRAYLSISRSELDPGQAYTATATIYATSPETMTVVLQPAPGLGITDPVRTVTADQDHPASVNWRVSVAPDAAAGLRRIWLTIDGRLRAYTEARVCCYVWPPALQPRLWLPLVRKT